MRKVSIRSVPAIALSLCALCAHAMQEIVLEAEPLHLAGCIANASDMTVVPTTLTAAVDEDAFYQGGYRRARYGGTLRKLEPDGSGAWHERWEAADRLAKRATARRLYTSDDAGRLRALEWQSLPLPQRQLLDRSSATGAPDGLGEQRLAWLHGERSGEQQNGGPFASRDSLLGAIVHGVPTVVPAPSGNGLPALRQAFVNAHRHRSAIVYVGAADGMLHGFDAINGDEVFAYLPHAVFDRLPALAADPRAALLTIDGGVAAADAMVGGQWRTVVAVGMGRGAQGVVALDVSAPERFGDAENPIWEFTDRDDADIGNVIGMPAIVRLRRAGNMGEWEEGHFVVVASGINNRRQDGHVSMTGANALFLLSLDRKRGEPWQQGVNYHKLVVPPGDPGGVDGMLELAVVQGVGPLTDRVYAADLQGNLWRFDLSQGAPWKDAGVNPRQPLFVAATAAGQRQAVTQKPAVVHAPGGGYVVLFGTGKYLERSDLSADRFAWQSFYAVLDRGNDVALARDDLVERLPTGSGAGESMETVQNEAAPAPFGPGRHGWYIDFPDSAKTGERVVSASTLADSSIVFHTLQPAAQACQPALAKLRALDSLTGKAANGGATVFPLMATMPYPIAVKTVRQTDAPTDAFGKRHPQPTIEVIGSDSSIPWRLRLNDPAAASGRMGWRELLNWHELRNVAGAK
ncbi:hypothetical protein GCM10007205_20180 [Oxalicibacterium flavum]|uniref:PilY1 beta-propeller domain-containing protein n=1 Tax=Oxalicibacterium flavum TaxID=179467 RepID=A0A8J2UMB9_9BURK|nr:hypothetical protein GCM10007205_20180 [Oxalicibacterium flavum]